MRPLIYGNGTLLVCVDERGVVRDFYYPYAGMENHGATYASGSSTWTSKSSAGLTRGA